MCEIKFKNKNNAEFNVIIDLNDKNIMNSGVYGFYIDNDTLLYIGQSFHFLSRLSQHLFELERDSSYFGLGKLENNHVITFKIIDDMNSYEFNNEDKIKEKETEKHNKKKRQNIEKMRILEYKPILQFNENKNIKHRKVDTLIKDSNTRNDIVKNILERNKWVYS